MLFGNKKLQIYKQTTIMKKKVLVAMAMIAMLNGAAMAQSSFTLKLGAGIPTGDFGEAKVVNGNPERWGLFTKDEEGGAGLGFNLGAEWRVPVASINGLGVVVSVDAFYNGMNEDINDLLDDLIEEADNNNVDATLTKPAYLNFPVMVGGNYRFEATPGIMFFGTAAVGANLRIVTPMSLEGEEDYYSDYYNTDVHEEAKVTISWKSTVSLSYRLAIGILFNEKYSIEMGYYNLGAGKVKAELEQEIYTSVNGSSNNSNKNTLKSITPEIFTLRFGISF